MKNCPFCGGEFTEPYCGVSVNLSENPYTSTSYCQKCRLTIQATGKTRDEANEFVRSVINQEHKVSGYYVNGRQHWVIEKISPLGAYLRGFASCEFCDVYPMLEIGDKYAKAQCPICKKFVEVWCESPQDYLRDEWNEDNER